MYPIPDFVPVPSAEIIQAIYKSQYTIIILGGQNNEKMKSGLRKTKSHIESFHKVSQPEKENGKSGCGI